MPLDVYTLFAIRKPKTDDLPSAVIIRVLFRKFPFHILARNTDKPAGVCDFPYFLLENTGMVTAISALFLKEGVSHKKL